MRTNVLSTAFAARPTGARYEHTQLAGNEPDLAFSGLKPGSVVTVVATRGGARDDQWVHASRNRFRVAADGTLDLKSATPLSGTYDRPDGRGILWSMKEGKKADVLPAGEVRDAVTAAK